MRFENLTIAFFIDNIFYKNLLLNNPTLDLDAKFLFIHTKDFWILNNSDKFKNFYLEKTKDNSLYSKYFYKNLFDYLPPILKSIETDWILFLEPYETIDYFQDLNSLEKTSYYISIETILDKNIRQNNLLCYKQRLFNKNFNFEIIENFSEINIFDYSKQIADVYNYKLKKYSELFENDCKDIDVILFLFKNNYSKINIETLLSKKNGLKSSVENQNDIHDLNIQIAKYYISKNKLKEAKNILISVLDVFDNSLFANYLLAEVYFKLFDYKNSEKYLKKCINLSENENYYKFSAISKGLLGYISYYSLGQTYISLNNFNWAKDCFQKSFEMGKNFLAAKKILEFLETKLEKNENEINLSVCMIVKNESDFLQECLESVKDIAYEIIIIDTGSEDNTIDIAKKYTSKVYSFEWTKDFSKARNESLKYASGDWILYLDGDEKINNNSLDLLRQAMNDPSKLAYLLPIKNYYENKDIIESSSFYTYRLFRNFPNVKFIGQLHEQVFDSLLEIQKTEKLDFAESNILIEHFGYTKKGLEKDEKNKTKDLELEILEKNVTDISLNQNKKIYFMIKLGIRYFLDGQIDKTKKIFNDILDISKTFSEKEKKQIPTLIDFYILYSQIYLIENNFKMSEALLLQGLNIFPNSTTILDELIKLSKITSNFDNEIFYSNQLKNLFENGDYYKFSTF